MKKIFTGIVIIVLILFALSWYLIPAKLTISSAASYHANKEAVYRFLISDSNWHKWWPGTASKNDNGTWSFRYDDYTIQIEKVMYDAIRLKLETNKSSRGSLLRVVPYAIDSLGIEISTEIINGPNPFNRITGYFRAKKTKRMLNDIITSLQDYTSDLSNIYGINIKKEKVQFQDLVSAKQSFPHYPTTEDIYSIIGKLRNYINRSGARELFSPMLNIRIIDSINYIAQVGLPIDKNLPEEGDITLKWMMKDGNILAGDVTGGVKQIEAAMKQFENYISDYQRSIIAIPFQMLITDRTKEPDSTKWVTRIYYPVV
jgi:hypothetical protein